MSQLVNYRIIEAGLRVLADKAHESAVAHICEQDGLDMMSEDPCYIMGSLCEQLFRVMQQ